MAYDSQQLPTAQASGYDRDCAAGHVISELTSTGGWNRGEIYAGGRHVATYVSSTTYFDHGDWLGTERARIDVNGDVSETCQGLPFGDGLSCSGSDPSPLHFTGKQRDSETGLDYFGARYDSSSVGRFMTPDWSAKVEPVPYAKLGDPQSLNLYVYVMDNPVTDLDAFGHCTTPGPNACGPTPPPAKHPMMANRQAHQQSLAQFVKDGLWGMVDAAAGKQVGPGTPGEKQAASAAGLLLMGMSGEGEAEGAGQLVEGGREIRGGGVGIREGEDRVRWDNEQLGAAGDRAR